MTCICMYSVYVHVHVHVYFLWLIKLILLKQTNSCVCSLYVLNIIRILSNVYMYSVFIHVNVYTCIYNYKLY